MKGLEEFKSRLILSGINKFKAEYPSILLDIKLWKTKLYLRELRKQGVVKRESINGNCKSLCASCYEYGCDADLAPPINYWVICDEYKNHEAIKERRRIESKQEEMFY